MRRTKLMATAGALAALALALPSEALAKGGADKAGRVMINIKVGPAIAIDDTRTQFSVSPEFAVALDKDYNAYLGLGPQFQFGDYFTLINIPLFFEYDIELPVKGLYLYPKIGAGLSYWANSYFRRSDEHAYFMLEPAFGVKYQFHKNVHVGGEPIAIPMYMGNIFAAQYHFFAYIGFDF